MCCVQQVVNYSPIWPGLTADLLCAHLSHAVAVIQIHYAALNCNGCCVQNIQVHFTSTQSSPKPESGLLSRPELEEMICWETNNLYEYLKDLYDQEHADLADYNRHVALLLALKQIIFC